MGKWVADVNSFWKPGGEDHCWVCGRMTKWAWADLGWQHRDCEMYPSEDGDVVIIHGKRVSEHNIWRWTNDVVRG